MREWIHKEILVMCVVAKHVLIVRYIAILLNMSVAIMIAFSILREIARFQYSMNVEHV